jgi:hypothetical protein
VFVDADPKLAVCLGAARWAAHHGPADEPTIEVAAPIAAPEVDVAAPVAAATSVTPAARSRTPMLIGAGIGAVVLVVVAVVALSGGGGSKPPAAAASSRSTTTSTVVATTAAPAPTTAAPPATQVVSDDTGTFAVELPQSFATDTAFRQLGGVDVAHISGADDLVGYLRGDWNATGVTVLVADRGQAGTVDQILTSFDPGGTCVTHGDRNTFSNALGSGLVQHFDGCGTGGAASQILAAVDLPQYGAVMLVGAIAHGASTEATQQLFESVADSISPLTN